MPNPSAVYVISANGTTLPGYCQEEDLPFSVRVPSKDILGRSGGVQSRGGVALRDITLRMRLLSRLGVGATGLQHVNDIKDQYRTAADLLDDIQGAFQLKIGESDRYLNVQLLSANLSLAAGQPTRGTYTLGLRANPPYFLGTTVSGSSTVSGSTSIVLSMNDTRKTYPVITVGSGITILTMAHSGSDKSMTLSGITEALTVDCSSLTISYVDDGSLSAVQHLTTSPDFGIYHIGSGSFSLDISAVTGSGTVSVEMQHRYIR